MAEIEQGTVGRITPGKGFGFVKRNSGEDIFFHKNGLQNCRDINLLREGDAVEFSVGPDSKNPQKQEAKNVHVLADVSMRTPAEFAAPPRRRRERSRSRDRNYGGESRGYGGRSERYESSHDRGYDRDPYARRGYDDPYGAPRRREAYDPYERRHDDVPPPRYERRHDDRYDDRPPHHRDDRPPHHRDDRYRREARPPTRREEGPIKSLSDRGFGFVQTNGGEDMFFPSKEVVNVKFDELKQGDIVSFVIGADPRDPSKWQAQQVRKVVEIGTIESLKNGFGFITNAQNEKIFFHGRHLQGSSFEELKEGDQLEYRAAESRSKRSSGSAFEAQEIKLLPQA